MPVHAEAREARQDAAYAQDSPSVASVADEQLWLPTRLDAVLPFSAVVWLSTNFPDAEAREAFVSTAMVMAVEAARHEAGAEKGGAL